MIPKLLDVSVACGYTALGRVGYAKSLRNQDKLNWSCNGLDKLV